jgi:hypothetical protein
MGSKGLSALGGSRAEPWPFSFNALQLDARRVGG